MFLSNSSDYAIRIMTEIAVRSDELPDGIVSRRPYIRGGDLCRDAGLPHEYVSKILAMLVNAKVLGSRKGPRGGFMLPKPARDISLLNVIEAIEGVDRLDWCIVRSAKCDDCTRCQQHNFFKPLRHRLRDCLQTTTLADTAASIRTSEAPVSQPSESSGQSVQER